MSSKIDPRELKAQLLASERPVPTSRWGRIWRTGRGAAGLVRATLGDRLRGGDGSLPQLDAAAIVQLVERLGELRGVAMKAGQILGYTDPSLPEELRGLLGLLQVSAPASPWVTVEATIREALGEGAFEILEGLDRRPVAVASIGQVHHGRLRDGREVAVKVRHPGVEEALRGDLDSARSGSSFASLLVPGAMASVRSMVEEARTALLEECDYRLEAERQATFGRLLAGHPVLQVPRVDQACSARAVLVSEWRPGEGLEAWLASAPSKDDRNRAGVALFELYLGTLYRHGFFHADPHPGNYGFLGRGDELAIVVYDFGCVRTFEAPSVSGGPNRSSLSRLLAAVRSDDPARIQEAMLGLGASPQGDAETLEIQRRMLRSFFGPMLEAGAHPISSEPGLDARHLLRDKRALMRLGLPGKVLFLFRLRFGLYAVLERLGAVADWAALEAEWAESGASVELP